MIQFRPYTCNKTLVKCFLVNLSAAVLNFALLLCERSVVLR